MHFHHYTLQHLAKYLRDDHLEERVLSCFSQNKNELVIELEGMHLRVGCHTPLTYIVPVKAFSKARKNVVMLFDKIVGKKLLDVRVLAWERVLILKLEGHYELLLKLHGARANALLRRHGEVTHLFNQAMEDDWTYEPVEGPYVPIQEVEKPQNLESVAELHSFLKAISPIYDRQFALQVYALMQSGLSVEDAFAKIINWCQDDRFFLVKEARRIRMLLFKPTHAEEWVEVSGIKLALQGFMAAHFQFNNYLQLYQKAQREVHKPYKKYKKIYASYQTNITKLENERNPEEIGHLIMANLHALTTGMEKATLDDFYSGEQITVRLKPALSPQDNAKRYYDKHKNRKAKVAYLRSQLDDIAEKMAEAEAENREFEELIPPSDLKLEPYGFDGQILRPLRRKLLALLKEQAEEEDSKSPFKTYRKANYEIFVGRNAKNNDLLSFKFANKEDLWLHAKDVTGSHVIVRQRPGQNIPEMVLEYAAGLAAYYSKRRNDSLVPVQYTPRKYIRKRKGDPAGFVVVEREEVIMAEPVKG